RELMQYDKKKNYDPVKYAQLKAQAPAGSSDADSIIYADKKVLEEITKYGDLTVWPLEDFKHDDSNWAYGVKKLSLDNAAPDVAFGGAIEDNSATVRLPLTITDKQSGTLTVQYQWTKKTESPIEMKRDLHKDGRDFHLEQRVRGRRIQAVRQDT
ncbi:MAG: hypothetical protein K0R28_1793, partial [Paenibacillus sp.]|nr:hypothetical protein [Paenibacillus sp.]